LSGSRLEVAVEAENQRMLCVLLLTRLLLAAGGSQVTGNDVT